MAAKLCVIEHRPKEPTWDPLSMCCLQEGGHVHAHVHHGEITEDIFLEQVCQQYIAKFGTTHTSHHGQGTLGQFTTWAIMW